MADLVNNKNVQLDSKRANTKRCAYRESDNWKSPEIWKRNYHKKVKESMK